MRETISALLLAWYDQNARTLPWRGIHDPYRTWVSETMLQQTRVETVRGYYERFLARFPDVAALAAAGMVPAPGAMQQFYVLLPYAGALVAGISAVWALARMSRGGARLRSYVYEETVAKLPLRCLLTGGFAALAAVGECMDVFLNGGQNAIRYAVLFAALAAAAAAAAFAAGHTIRAAVYTEESDSGREK